MSAKKIGENQWLVDVDSRGRVSLGKIVGDQELFRVSEHNGKIYLEPVTAYTDAELLALTDPVIRENHRRTQTHPETYTSAEDLP